MKNILTLSTLFVLALATLGATEEVSASKEAYQPKSENSKVVHGEKIASIGITTKNVSESKEQNVQ